MSDNNSSWISIPNFDGENITFNVPSYGSNEITISSLVHGGINANGNFIGTVVGNDKLKIDISYAFMTPEEFKKFLKVFDCRCNRGGKLVNRFRVFDPRENNFVEMDMYIGDRSGRPLSLDECLKPTGWTDVSATLIEV